MYDSLSALRTAFVFIFTAATTNETVNLHIKILFL